MPHIKLEYTDISDGNKLNKLYSDIIDLLITNTTIKNENCKFKSINIPLNPINVSHFAHLEILFLEGRTNHTKKIIGEKCIQILKNNLLDLNEKKQFSIEIRETNFNNYFTTNKI